MLHHYNNYSNSLNRLLANYQQLEEESTSAAATNGNDLDHQLATSSHEDSNIDEAEEEPLPRCTINSSATNKSFTIAAILGLNNNNNENSSLCGNSTDLDVVNLSDHQAQTTSDRTSSFEPITCRLPFAVNHRHTSYIPTSAQYHHTTKSTIRNLKSIGCRSIHQQNNKKPCKSKRVRTIFTPEQLERLEAEFEKQQYMVGPERLYLAHTLQLTEAQVKVWFQNRRIKWRKHHLELTHQRLAALKQQQQQQQQMLLDETLPEIRDANSSGTDS